MKGVLGKMMAVKPLMIVAMTGGLIASTYNVYTTSDSLKKASVLEGGLGTCFSRVNQTYTARMLGDQYSPYLETSFTNITEECMADVIDIYENSFKKDVQGLAKKLNTLSSDIHWFHTRVLQKESAALVGNGVKVTDFGPRFERIEVAKDSSLERIGEYKATLGDLLSSLKMTFYSLAILLPLFLLWDFFERRRLRVRNKEIENDALNELSSEDFTTDNKVQEIIKTALEQNELIFCSKLFNKYHNNMTEKLMNESLVQRMNTVELIKNGPKEEVEAQIERLWSQAPAIEVDAEVEVEPTCSLDRISMKVVDHLSNKLLAEGVRIEMKGDSDLFVKGEEENIEQIVYQLITNSVKMSQDAGGAKRVVVETKRLGSLIIADIYSYGEGYDSDFIAFEKGLSATEKEKCLALVIAEELAAELDGKIQYDNFDEGARTKITLHAGKKSESAKNVEETQKEEGARLVSVTKGTKKELLEQMKLN